MGLFGNTQNQNQQGTAGTGTSIFGAPAATTGPNTSATGSGTNVFANVCSTTNSATGMTNIFGQTQNTGELPL